MSHSDDYGLVIPPKLAPIQLVIVPIYNSRASWKLLMKGLVKLIKPLKELGVSVKYDNRTTYKPGWKFAEYELKGVPLRMAMGPRDLENVTVELARRDTLKRKLFVKTRLRLK